MEQLITREYWIPKVVTAFGVFAGFCNIVLSDFFCNLHFTTFHLTVSLIYMTLAVGTALYCIHRRLKSPLMTAAIHWSAVLLLTMPEMLGNMGLLTTGANSNGLGYGIMIWMLDAALFGVGRLFEREMLEPVLGAFPVLFAALMLALIGWGMRRIQR